MTIRKTLAEALDPSLRVEPGLSRTNTWVVILICLSIALGVAETEAALTDGFERYYDIAHLVFFVMFLVEYIARLYCAPENPRYGSSLAYALTFSSILDLLVLISFALPFFGLEGSLLRVFRAARLVRLAKMGRYSLALQMVYHAMSERKYELGVSIVIAFSLMLLASTALYLAERSSQPEIFGSIPRAMWWAVATLTTVGYGDTVPITVLGRIAAGLTAVAGVGLIALPTGILAGAFTEGISRARNQK
jgi:voltage-gated potassium channel